MRNLFFVGVFSKSAEKLWGVVGSIGEGHDKKLSEMLSNINVVCMVSLVCKLGGINRGKSCQRAMLSTLSDSTNDGPWTPKSHTNCLWGEFASALPRLWAHLGLLISENEENREIKSRLIFVHLTQYGQLHRLLHYIAHVNVK